MQCNRKTLHTVESPTRRAWLGMRKGIWASCSWHGRCNPIKGSLQFPPPVALPHHVQVVCSLPSGLCSNITCSENHSLTIYHFVPFLRFMVLLSLSHALMLHCGFIFCLVFSSRKKIYAVRDFVPSVHECIPGPRIALGMQETLSQEAVNEWMKYSYLSWGTGTRNFSLHPELVPYPLFLWGSWFLCAAYFCISALFVSAQVLSDFWVYLIAPSLPRPASSNF